MGGQKTGFVNYSVEKYGGANGVTHGVVGKLVAFHKEIRAGHHHHFHIATVGAHFCGRMLVARRIYI